MTIRIVSVGDADRGETKFWRRINDLLNDAEEICSPDCYHCPYCTLPLPANAKRATRQAKCPKCDLWFVIESQLLFVGRSLIYRAPRK